MLVPKGWPQRLEPFSKQGPPVFPSHQTFSRLLHCCATACSYCTEGTGMLSLRGQAALLPVLTFSGPQNRKCSVSCFKNLTEFPLRFSPCPKKGKKEREKPISGTLSLWVLLWEQLLPSTFTFESSVRERNFSGEASTLSLLSTCFWQLALEIPKCSVLAEGLWSCRQVKHRQNTLTASFPYAQALFWLVTETQSLPFFQLRSKQ